ncbi:hypothetical protein PT2222_300026 [Paraburkholderia tropica]
MRSSLPRLLMVIVVVDLVQRLEVVALEHGALDRADDRMRGDGRARHAGDAHADAVGVLLDAELVDVDHAVVERALVPEAVFGAAETAVARLDRERHAVVPAHRRAGVVGGRALAAHLVEAVALARAFVVPAFDELARVEVRTPVAFVVNALAVEHLRAALAVERRQAVERDHVGDHGGHHFGNGRAARHLDDGLVENHVGDRRGARGIGLRRLHAAPRGARAPRDDGLGVGAHALELFDEGLAAGEAEHAVFVERRIAFHGDDVVALVLRADVFEDRLGLVAGGGHDRVVVVERDHGENRVLRERVRAADERFGAARAFEPVQPDHRRARTGFERVCDARHERRTETERGGRETAELQEAAPRHTLCAHGVVERLQDGLLDGPCGLRKIGMIWPGWPSCFDRSQFRLAIG